MKKYIKKKQEKNKINQSSEFPAPADGDDFKILMERAGVKELDSVIVDKTPCPNQETEETIRFDESPGDIEFSTASIADKFTSKNRKRKTAPTKKVKRLKPGFIPDIELDLHGHTQKEALREIHRIVDYCRGIKLESLLIITGKGWNSSSEGGVLRKIVWDWLETNQKEMIYRFRWAPRFLGGKGAIIVFFN
jgi:DNA-nicking Smr family endonuclease